MTIELESLADLDAHVARHGSLQGTASQGVDLSERSWLLRETEVAGAAFLGCRFDEGVIEHLVAQGALVFPRFPRLDFRTYRSSLYSPEELFAGFDPERPGSYAECLDQRIYQWHVETGRSGDILFELAQRIHDHSIDDALTHLLESGRGGNPRRVVAVMGGHGMRRDDPGYRQVAHLARDLAREGFLVASGGGPGAMEAANLGPRFSNRDDADLAAALAELGESPGFQPEHRWLASALAVGKRYPVIGEPALSLGVPTWHYGHEPPNVFASWIAKYFANSIREEGLLAIATAGVIFAPGSAGTIQEVFQDATQNHYASFGVVSPMVFLGRRFWTETKPVFPLLVELARGHDYAAKLSVVDEVEEAVAAIIGGSPV